MADVPITRKFVDGAWIAFTPAEADTPTLIPLTQFEVKYAMNTIPTASVVPAIGFNIRKATDVTTITGLKENTQVRLIFSSDGEQVVLMEGFVQSITVQQQATAFSRKSSANIVIKHNAVRLAGSPPVSFAFTTQNAPNLQTLYATDKLQLLVNPQANPNANAPTDIFPLSALIRQVTQDVGQGATTYPSLLLEYIAESLASEWGLFSDLDAPDDVIRGYQPANLTHLRVSSALIVQAIGSMFSKNFPNTNTWESLVRTANHFYLDIVPFNTGVYVANPTSLLRTPDKVLTPAEYTQLTDTEAFSMKEPVDGIAVFSPVQRTGNLDRSRTPAVWPRLKPTEGGEDGVLLEKGRYYHFREFPRWLAMFEDSLYGSANSSPVNEENPGATEDDRQPEQNTEDYLDIGERIAKAIYSRARMSKKTLGVVLPWRTDLMPGSVVRIEVPDDRPDYFVTEDLYGHITQTTLRGDLLSGSGKLNTIIRVSAARTEEDNADENLTFETHPLYQERWVGIDLFGNAVDGIPEHTTLDTGPSVTFNSTTGQASAT